VKADREFAVISTTGALFCAHEQALPAARLGGQGVHRDGQSPGLSLLLLWLFNSYKKPNVGNCFPQTTQRQENAAGDTQSKSLALCFSNLCCTLRTPVALSLYNSPSGIASWCKKHLPDKHLWKLVRTAI